MPKRFLKRITPDPDFIKQHKYLSMFGEVLHNNNLWHMNRHSVARAFSVGLFCAFMPIPFQMVLAAALAIVWRANLALSVCLVWITNPITMAPIFYFSYHIGATILHMPHQHFHIELSMQWLASQFIHIWEPLLLGSLICGVIAAILGNLMIRLLWRIMVIRSWSLRRRRKK